MNYWTIGLIIFGGILFLYYIYGLLLPRTWEVKESMLIPAEGQQLFDYLNRMRNWEIWTHWNNESKMGFKFSYDGPESGEGSTQKWSAKRGKGETKITGGQAPDRIDYQFSFGKGKQVMEGKLELAPEGDGVRVDWTVAGQPSDNPSIKITAKMMRPYIAKDLRRGLERLQGIASSWEGTTAVVDDSPTETSSSDQTEA